MGMGIHGLTQTVLATGLSPVQTAQSTSLVVGRWCCGNLGRWYKPNCHLPGITFPATQNASSNANTLDDYEEGTWTGLIAGSTTAGTFTNLINACSYTKIGRQVTVQYYVQWESGTGTGNLILTGLPFTSRNESGFYYAGTLSYANVLRTANATPAPNIYHNATQIEFLQIPTTDGDSTSIAYDAAGRLMGMHTYFTA
jgi:hypothetical protein